jgi:hypothetical protein
VDEISLEGVDAFDIGPFPVAERRKNQFSCPRVQGWQNSNLLQNAAGIDKNVGLLVDSLVVTILDLDVPFAFGFIPRRAVDGMLVFDVLITVVLLGNIVHVGVYLLRGSVVVGPLRVRCKAERIIVSWDVAFALRIVSITSPSKMK